MYGHSQDLYEGIVNSIPEVKWLHPNRHVTYPLSETITLSSAPYGKARLGFDKSIFTEDFVEAHQRLYGWTDDSLWGRISDVAQLYTIFFFGFRARMLNLPGPCDVCVILEDNKSDIEYGLYLNNTKGDAKLLFKAWQNHNYDQMFQKDPYYNLEERKLRTDKKEFLDFLIKLEL